MAKPTQASSFIHAQFAANNLSVAQLIADFDQWKAMPERDPETAVFGRNGLNAGSTILSHVHMVPLGIDEAAR